MTIGNKISFNLFIQIIFFGLFELIYNNGKYEKAFIFS